MTTDQNNFVNGYDALGNSVFSPLANVAYGSTGSTTGSVSSGTGNATADPANTPVAPTALQVELMRVSLVLVVARFNPLIF